MVERVYIFVEPIMNDRFLLHYVLLASKNCLDDNLWVRKTIDRSQHCPSAASSAAISCSKRFLIIYVLFDNTIVGILPAKAFEMSRREGHRSIYLIISIVELKCQHNLYKTLPAICIINFVHPSS